MRPLAQLFAVLASAWLYGAAFPPNPWRACAWIALVPLFVVFRNSSTSRAVVLTWIWTVALGCVVNGWFPGTVAAYFGQPWLVGFMLFLGVCTFTCGIETMLFAVAYPRLTARPAAIVPLLVAAAWVSADVLRLVAFGGDPWGLIGYSQVGLLPLMQVADLAGVHGVTFVVVAVNAAVAELAMARGPDALWRAGGGAALTALLLVVALCYGTVRLRTVFPAAGAAVGVGVVQANLPLGSQWRRSFYGRNLDVYEKLSLDVLRSAKPRLLIWPESAMTFFVGDEPAYRRALGGMLSPFGAELVAGGPYAESGGMPPFRNAAFHLMPDGQIRARYDKQLLLPFAEYFPLGSIDILRRNFGRVREFVPGGDATLLDTAAGRVGVVICNEGFFAGPAADRVHAGATVLVNLANDSWLGQPKYSEPAFDMVRLRAVEQRRWIVRASTAGPSAFIDPYGRAVARTALFESTTLAGSVTPLVVVTPYARAGDLFAWACVGTTLFACRRRRATRLRAS